MSNGKKAKRVLCRHDPPPPHAVGDPPDATRDVDINAQIHFCQPKWPPWDSTLNPRAKNGVNIKIFDITVSTRSNANVLRCYQFNLRMSNLSSKV